MSSHKLFEFGASVAHATATVRVTVMDESLKTGMPRLSSNVAGASAFFVRDAPQGSEGSLLAFPCLLKVRSMEGATAVCSLTDDAETVIHDALIKHLGMEVEIRVVGDWKVDALGQLYRSPKGEQYLIVRGLKITLTNGKFDPVTPEDFFAKRFERMIGTGKTADKPSA